MSYLLIDNFAAGLDRRRSAEMAAPGSLRQLQNAFINEGGEIEKRKAMVRDDVLTAYAQDARWRGLVSGPFPVPGSSDTVFFRHHHPDLPAAPFVEGPGGVAAVYATGSGLSEKRVWVQSSALATPNHGALFHGASSGVFSTTAHILEQYVSTATEKFTQRHVKVDFTGDEPTGETEILVNAERDFLGILDTKGYVVQGDDLYISAVNDPGDMAGIGSGVINVSTKGGPIGELRAVADYYGTLAVFGSDGVQFYQVDPDVALTQYLRRANTDLLAPRSVINYGDGDLLFLARTGVRSLRARDSSNFARVDDIGSPVDKLLRAQLGYDEEDVEPIFSSASPDVVSADFYGVSTAEIVKENGQMWIAVGDRVYALSRFPGAKVQAWSTFMLPVPTVPQPSAGQRKSRWIADIAKIGQTVMFRNFADEVFVYGGPNANIYDDSNVIVELPFADMGRPGDEKTFHGIDVICTGDWRVEASMISDTEGKAVHWFPIAEVHNSSRHKPRIPMDHKGNQIALRLTSTEPRAATIAQIGIYYSGGIEK